MIEYTDIFVGAKLKENDRVLVVKEVTSNTVWFECGYWMDLELAVDNLELEHK